MGGRKYQRTNSFDQDHNSKPSSRDPSPEKSRSPSPTKKEHRSNSRANLRDKSERLHSSQIDQRPKPHLGRRRHSTFSEPFDISTLKSAGNYVASFSDSEDENIHLERISKDMRGKSPSPERPSWGFGNSRVPSRQELRNEYEGRTILF